MREVSSRRTRENPEKGLIELMDTVFVNTESESEDIEDQETEKSNERHPFWTTPPR